MEASIIEREYPYRDSLADCACLFLGCVLSGALPVFGLCFLCFFPAEDAVSSILHLIAFGVVGTLFLGTGLLFGLSLWNRTNPNGRIAFTATGILLPRCLIAHDFV